MNCAEQLGIVIIYKRVWLSTISVDGRGQAEWINMYGVSGTRGSWRADFYGGDVWYTCIKRVVNLLAPSGL